MLGGAAETGGVLVGTAGGALVEVKGGLLVADLLTEAATLIVSLGDTVVALDLEAPMPVDGGTGGITGLVSLILDTTFGLGSLFAFRIAYETCSPLDFFSFRDMPRLACNGTAGGGDSSCASVVSGV